ncbi:protein-disulfide isomerase [Thioalkalivibrio denitrificans]|uniref:Thiol:disulfide interchange protein n=1 Tax=Thioalkalivibrio denitrificans TaxID=108003 RepID=A0A1V3NEC0_9GAMM|nr:DsbC family protein [Thioalkalivibrio denitrificans]OOG23146.1 protein-disulfide isomerase [Thioalkalivibrio denitrificans]
MVKSIAMPLLICLGALWFSAAQAADPDLARQVEEIPESDLIIYSPGEPRYHATVFTDVNCPFCRRLHTEMDDYLLFDIEIRYAAFPSIDNALEQMHAVWCSDDRKDAITRAKQGNTIENPDNCQSSAVDDQLDIALRNRFMGTPAIVTPKGRVLYGHVSAEDLADALEQER